MKNKRFMLVVGIDIGIVHLGIVLVKVTDQLTVDRVIQADLVDLTTLVHRQVSLEDCRLYHTSAHSDLVDHLMQEYAEWFHDAQWVAIERQPPMGFVSIEQLIFRANREKAVLVSPASMHTFFNLGGSDYERRKELMEKHTYRYVGDFTEDKERKHDVADAMGVVMCFLHKMRMQRGTVRRMWMEKITPIVLNDEERSKPLADRLQRYRRNV